MLIDYEVDNIIEEKFELDNGTVKLTMPKKISLKSCNHLENYFKLLLDRLKDRVV